MFSQLRQHRSQYLEAQIFFISKAVSAPLDDANLVVEPFNESQRDFVFWPAVSGNPVPMTLDHRGKFLIRLKPLPFERGLPVLKEASCPTLALVAPQLTKGLLEQIAVFSRLLACSKAFNGWRPWRLRLSQRDNSAYFCPLMNHRSLLASRPYSLFLT
jgi:hypothetical protein